MRSFLEGIESTNRPWPIRFDMPLLLLVALVSRVVYFSQYSSRLPFLYGPIADSVAYLEQAFRVRAGEFGSPVLLAFSPLYGYFLALIRVDKSLVIPVIVQHLLGCVSVLFLYYFVRKSAGRRAALFSSALYLGYGTLLYFESKILSETLGLFIALIATGFYLGDGVRSGKLSWSMLTGALFGLAILARASLIFSAPIIVACAILPWSRPREHMSDLIRRAVGVAIGMSIIFGANGAWTKWHSGLFVPVILVSRTIETSTSRPFHGSLSDVTEGDRIVSSYDVVEQARQRLSNKVEERKGEGGHSTLRAIDYRGWLLNSPSKLWGTFSNAESNYQYGYLGEKSVVTMLNWLPFGFAFILIWGVMGGFCIARKNGARALLPYLPLILGVLITTTLYHPSSRYRLAMILPMVMLAGPGFAEIIRLRATVFGKCSAIILVVLSAYMVHDTYRRELHSRADFELQLASSYSMAGDKKAAWHHAQQAAIEAPHDPRIQKRVGMFRPPE
jgi:4-amino-4-deoxy-L-arabinose transferase-like glycosyltransferase